MRLIRFLKPLLATVLIVILIKVTGFMGTASFFTQKVALHSGFLGVGTEELKQPKQFDYNFNVKDLSGKKINFEDFKGRVIFLNLWATWCGPCRAEMADIQNLYDRMDKNKVAFVMLSIDEDNNKAKVESYIRNKAFTFPVFMPSGYLSEQLQVPSIPTTFVISKEGKIILKEIGSTNYNTEKFKLFLEEKSNN